MNFKEICEGLHLLARPMLASITSIVLGFVVTKVPDIPIEILGAISAPTLAYIAVKWTGKTTN